jgi:phosphatidylglycerophosphatase GEP4
MIQNSWDRCKMLFGPHRMVIVSNSAGTPDDIQHIDARLIEAKLGVNVLRHAQKKPWGADALFEHFKPLKPHEIAVIGDRVLTDVVYANQNGMMSILTWEILSTENDNGPAAMVKS